MCRSLGEIDYPTRPGIVERRWWVSHISEKLPQLIHAPLTTTDSDDDASNVTTDLGSDTSHTTRGSYYGVPPTTTDSGGGSIARLNTTVSDFCDRIDHPIVDE